MFPEGFKLWALYTRLSGDIYTVPALLGYAVILAKGAGKLQPKLPQKEFQNPGENGRGLFQ